jgi:hypothetical protein
MTALTEGTLQQDATAKAAKTHRQGSVMTFLRSEAIHPYKQLLHEQD